MLFIAIAIAIVLYVVIYAAYDYLTRSHTVGYDVLSSLRGLILKLPDDIGLAALKWAIGLTLFYLVSEMILNALRPSRATRSARARRRLPK